MVEHANSLLVDIFHWQPPDSDNAETEDEARAERRWLLEDGLARVRWLALALLVGLLPLFPPGSRLPTLCVAGVLALCNAVAQRLLRGGAQSRSLRLACALATGIEWSGCVTLVLAHSARLNSDLPALLLFLPLLGAARYRWRGLLAATVGAWAVVGVSVALQVWAHGVLDATDALAVAGEWCVMLAVMAALIGGLLRVGDMARADRAAQHAELCALRTRLHEAEALARPLVSTRELEVLRLLNANGHTYRQVASELHVDETTIKTHMRRLAEKFGVRGRDAVLACARERGLVPDPQLFHADDRLSSD
jgi:DNA-binding CsgD family transcriptional regulator